MAKLSLIITHHDEPMELGRNLFRSIDMQLCVDWNEVDIIVCDNTGKYFPYSEIIDDCLNIKDKIVFLNNSLCEGPGLNKQQGLDYCKTEYFTYLEFDDMLYSAASLWNMFNVIKQSPELDFLQFEHTLSTSITYDEKAAHNSFGGAWGTVQKKSFFTKNNIKQLNLKKDNDIYINKLCRCIKDKKVQFFNTCIYVWCIRENSTSTINLSKDSNFDEDYKDKIESAIKVIQLVYNYCLQNPETTEFNYEKELWDELPYFYWKTQMYKEDVSNKYDKQLIFDKEQQIVSLYLSIIDKQWLKEHSNMFQEYTTIGDETFENWLIRIFNLEM